MSVHAAVARRFSPPQWATFFEVRNDAGFDGKRTADAVAMCTWPGRGLSIEGIEVKSHRGDWLREMRDPAKSEPIIKFCNRWWLAAADDSIAKLDELPETWGLLVLRGKDLVQVKKAPALKPVALDRGFVAMLLRSATKGMVAESTVAELVQAGLEKHIAMHKTSADWQLERITKDYDALLAKCTAFEEASGIKLNDPYAWGAISDPKKLGACVRALMSGSIDSHGLAGARNTISAVLRDIETAVEALDALGRVAAE